MSIHEIRVTSNSLDPLGEEIKVEAERTLGFENIDEVRTAKVYRLQGITEDEAVQLAEKLFTDPITEQYTVRKPTRIGDVARRWGQKALKPFGFPQVVEVAYKPGVMNPEVSSIQKASSDLGVRPEAADSSREYRFLGKVRSAQVDNVVGRLLVNETVEQVVKKTPKSLTFEGNVGPITTIPIRNASEKELMDLSKDKLFLDAKEMGVVQDHFRKLDREPTDAELEIIAGRWSEHCGHKTFNAKVIVDGLEKDPLFTRIKNTAREHFKDLVVSAFNDNAGVMKFYDGQAISGKVETHNSPSAIEPYGGAMTGSGGVFRDIMGTGQGAKTIISTDMFCFAPPDLDESLLPPGTLNPDYLQRRVVQGVRDYGNRMGIPTANGSVHYHEDFRAKPTVIVGAYGIMPESRAEQGHPEVGDSVVIIGGRTGRDGIHGATFSSGEMTERTASVNSSAVQIGNAIEEKRMFDALIQARDEDCIRAMTDCGAAGFSSAVGEMAEEVGVTVDISKAPLKYPGLSPWEIWMSESQERMVAAISPEKIAKFLEICETYNVEATVIGEFDGSHTLTVNYGEDNLAELDYKFLKDGLPQREMHAKWTPEVLPEIKPEAPFDQAGWIERLKKVLSHGNVCSKEPVVRQYDHGVQGGNIVPPFGGIEQDGPNDALVVRPILDKPYGVVQSHGMDPILNRINPYEGSKWAVAEAMANYVAVGGNPDEAVLVNNFIWPFPDEREMGSLDLSVDAIVDMMNALETPVISGKDSLSSTYRGKDGLVIKIPPVLCMSAFGRIPDVEKTTTSDLKRAGSTLVLVGELDDGMGGSTYYDVAGGSSNRIPTVNAEALPHTLRAVYGAINSGEVLSCHDVSEGGTLTAVSEMCFGGNLGAKIEIEVYEDAETLLFGETAGCFVVEIPNEETAEEIFRYVPYLIIGKTTEQKVLAVSQQSEVFDDHRRLFKISTDELKKAWQEPMKRIFH